MGIYEKTNGSKEGQVYMLAGSLVSHDCRNIIEIFSTLEIKKYINELVYKCQIKYSLSSLSLGFVSMDSVN